MVSPLGAGTHRIGIGGRNLCLPQDLVFQFFDVVQARRPASLAQALHAAHHLGDEDGRLVGSRYLMWTLDRTEDEIEAKINEWSREQTAEDLMALLQSKGVPAGSRPTRYHRSSPTFPKARVSAKTLEML